MSDTGFDTPNRLVLAYGERIGESPKSRAFAEALRSSGIPYVYRDRDTPTEIDPDNDFVIAMSSTVRFEEVARTGVEMYPTPEQMVRAVDKWELYNWCRQNDVATPLTIMLPREKIVSWQTSGKMREGVSRLDKQLGGSIVKPRITIGETRLICNNVYQIPAQGEVWDTIVSHARQIEDDYVFQQQIHGETMKVYGVAPNVFYYLSWAGDTEPQECPPQIARFCEFAMHEFKLYWGGFDFIRNPETGLWYFIDLNPTTGGRKLPKHLTEIFQQQMHTNLRSLVRHEDAPYHHPNTIQTTIAVAGKNERLRTITGDGPKSLLGLPDGDTVLDKAIRPLTIFTKLNGFEPTIQLMRRPDHEAEFDGWKTETQPDIPIAFIEPAYDRMTGPADSLNNLFTVLPESTFLLSLAGDRVVDVPEENLRVCGERIKAALVDEGYPFVVVGIPTDTSKYSYKLDIDGRILSCDRDAEEDGRVHIKKLVFACDTRKMLVTGTRNSQEAINALAKAGVLGKLILLDGVSWVGDLDTPEDLDEFTDHFGVI